MWSRARDHVHEPGVLPATRQRPDCVGIEGALCPSAPSGVLTCEGQASGRPFLSRARRQWVPGVLMLRMAWPDQRGGERASARQSTSS